MLFLEDDIDRLVMRKSDSQPSLLGGMWNWITGLKTLPRRSLNQVCDIDNEGERDSENNIEGEGGSKTKNKVG